MKALRVLSIIGFVWYIIWLGVFSDGSIDGDTMLGCAMLAFGYAVAHSIVALIQGIKWQKTVLKVMSIIGFVWYGLSFIVIDDNMYDYDSAYGWQILGTVYAIAFAIVTLVLSFKKARNDLPQTGNTPTQNMD
jgi:peptidoglycan/LPS O-acetylase OafA/YrhL